MSFGGCYGKRLRIDLSNLKFYEEQIPIEVIKNYIGGRGLNIRLMLDEIEPGIDPFSEKNLLVLGVGPLIGTATLFANRLTISGKSPLTEVLGDSSIGGEVGTKMKNAGFDQVIITGKSTQPLYLIITDNGVEFKDASHIWGKNISEANLLIKREIGDIKASMLCIGPAGENMVRYACILSDDHAAGRTGMGAIMGSKKIKAIVFQGMKKPTVNDRKGLSNVMKELSKALEEDPAIEKAKKYGASTAIEGFNSIGVLEVRNLQTGILPQVDKISGKTVRDNHAIKHRKCLLCPIDCRVLSLFHSKEFGSFILGGPEFASLQNFGARIGNTELDAICYMTKLANDYGIDYMSFCGVVSWLMECKEKGLISEKDIDGLRLDWGNYNDVILMMEMTSFRRGVGDILAEGAYRANRLLNINDDKYILTIKKMEFEGCDPRGYKGRGVGFGVSARGADNCRTLCAIETIVTADEALELFGHTDAANLRGVKGKGNLLKYIEDLTAISELLGLCRYGMYSYVSTLDRLLLRTRLIAKAFSYVTGLIDVDESLLFLLAAGERLINAERLFNVREGLGRHDDLLPKRFRFEAMPEGPAKGSVVENDDILDEYYEARGWDIKTGIPLHDTITRLGIDKF